MNLEQQKSRHISTLCSALGYSRQAYYQQRSEVEQGALQHELIIQQVLLIRTNQKKVGTRKLFIMIQSFLSEHNITIGRDALFTLLSENNLLIRRRMRKVPRTTFSDHWLKKHPNLIVGMPVVNPNTLWVSDITYITMVGCFSYLSLITDAYSRMIVGYCLCEDLSAQGCVKALKMALKQLPADSVLIHHSDRGCQYCCTDYVEQLTENNIAISMTQNSDPRENAIAERVNGIIKLEFLENRYSDFNTAKDGVAKAVYTYNNERLHSSIDMLTPFQAQTMTGELKRRWKNYYTKKEKEVPMT